MKYKYVGNGAFIPGLPARDLDDAELSAEQRQALAAAVDKELYIRMQEEAPVRPQKSPKAAQTGS